MEMQFTDKNVVVIGGTSGINRGVAEYFAARGARVAVASRKRDKVVDTVEALEALGASVYGFVADVRNESQVKEGLAEAYRQWGSIDILISGAAGNFPALAKDLSSNGFGSVVEIDLFGTFHVMQSSYKFLTTPGASVINISAPQAFLPMMGQVHACSAKAGVDMITRCLAMEWGPDGIRVNSVVPGPIAGTEGMRRLTPSPALVEAARLSVPLKRLGTAQDVAHACGFLSSPWASFINGVVLPVDGGWHLAGASMVSNILAEAMSSQTKG